MPTSRLPFADNFVASPYFNERPQNETINLLVIHNISLPAGQFGTSYVNQLFTGQWQKPVPKELSWQSTLEVSAHLFIRRDGEIIQYVPFDKRAWHAGLSSFGGRKNCNDFSIGIELEGTDTAPYTDAQYNKLTEVTQYLMTHFPITKERICGHSDIAPGRKTDPGDSFDWTRYLEALTNR